MADAVLITPLFDEAVAAIQSAVLQEHRLHFQSDANASLLLDELCRVSVNNGSVDQRVVACSRKLTLFIRTLAPYFDLLSTCIKLQPEWISWFWGALRLVIKRQMSSAYVLLLEKVADMLEAIAHVMPPYQQIYEACSANTPDSNVKDEDFYLAALMSYVYADFVQLFLELYCIFCRGSQAHTMSWRPLDSRISRMEVRLAKHRRWLEKETQNDIQNYSDISHHRKHYLDFLQNQDQIRGSDNLDHDGQRAVKRWRRVEKVRNWLCHSSATSQVDRQPRQYSPDSCAWFLQSSVYCKWRDQPFEKAVANDTDYLLNNWQHRVLFVQAQIGFGKTFMSHSVIENLTAETEDPNICDEPPVIAYYRFSLLHSKHNHPDDALRALSHQLLQLHRNDHSTLDSVCLLLRKTSFREHANTDEVLDVLTLLLRQHPAYIAIDGIDECNNTEVFLGLLARLCRGSDARVILFSRPDLKIPLEYQKWASDAPHILSLKSSHNAMAIESYSTPELNRLADQGFFGISMDRTLIPQFAQAANGEFLWASMLLKLLQSPLISPEERLNLLLNVQSLEGLGSLYHTMIDALARHSHQKKRVIASAFRWLSHGIHHLDPAALRAALSTQSKDENEISHTMDIVNALEELSCGLLLVTNDAVSFAHASVRDFLQSSASHTSEFSLHNEIGVHGHLAADCLSYLVYSVPKQPLGVLHPHNPPTPPAASASSGASQRTNSSGDSGYKSLSSSDGDNNHAVAPIILNPRNSSSRPNSIRTIPFDTHLPLLRYAALCWPIHLSRALTLSSHSTTSSMTDTLAYLPALSAFLYSRLAITSWVEASFRYSLPPTLTRLVGPLSDLKGEISPSTATGRELRCAVGQMRILSERLAGLKREHEVVMRRNPSLIWQMDEPGEDAYWPVWEDVVASASVP
ncbi:hypothetical protein PSV08DRAFT_399634 [Bipolaris maydis]|uniref:uncharacterized protein n=1 Tax=Cochliobolus heterostrophus TaxID=5016 RepID=UPI0024D8F011|nr:hypothetical protein J3E73DRAFT_419867 [Bipolaris maydis]KAJ5060208.1 hypothetical protein J3E74DRAFT_474644 [Bipolaris maydis]KAJ6273401.1 hypothetical protein PSV08DRAFT_399634 [Bipolaris maydis]KAJ6284614.1 hypothetical protein J3E71DRAFT_397033 [Bipolaris maydis]